MSSAVPLPRRSCSCAPDPGELPCALLTATVDDPQVDPALLALTVSYERGKWRARDLARHIVEWVPDFALRRSEREGVPAGRMMEKVRQAVKITFGNSGDHGVAGEVLLHAVCRHFFGSDTVINKVWFKTAINDTYKGFDAVHCVHMGDELQLWLGEAKFYQDLSKAIRSALSDISAHLEQDYLRTEFGLIADKIDDGHPHARELCSLMHPNTSLDEVFDRVVVPVLIAYDSAATAAHCRVCPEYEMALVEEVRTAWRKFDKGLDSRIPVTIRLFLVPMATKQRLLEALKGELPWR